MTPTESGTSSIAMTRGLRLRGQPSQSTDAFVKAVFLDHLPKPFLCAGLVPARIKHKWSTQLGMIDGLDAPGRPRWPLDPNAERALNNKA